MRTNVTNLDELKRSAHEAVDQYKALIEEKKDAVRNASAVFDEKKELEAKQAAAAEAALQLSLNEQKQNARTFRAEQETAATKESQVFQEQMQTAKEREEERKKQFEEKLAARKETFERRRQETLNTLETKEQSEGEAAGARPRYGSGYGRNRQKPKTAPTNDDSKDRCGFM